MNITLPRFGPDLNNDDRAAMVAPLVEAFARTYYHGTETVAVIVGDLIADLGHLLDRAHLLAHVEHVITEPEDDPAVLFVDTLDTALDHYQYETQEEDHHG